jgi:hypothetical protein
MDAVAYRNVDVDGINIFYREAGPKEAPTFRWTVKSSPPGGAIRLSVDLLEPPPTLNSASGPLNLFP